MTIKFYANDFSPPSRAVHLALKTVGLNFIFVEVDFFKEETQSKEFKKINPRAKIPALVDGDMNVGESRAIMQYICNKMTNDGKKQVVYPVAPKPRAIVDQLLQIDIEVVRAIYDYVVKSVSN